MRLRACRSVAVKAGTRGHPLALPRPQGQPRAGSGCGASASQGMDARTSAPSCACLFTPILHLTEPRALTAMKMETSVGRRRRTGRKDTTSAPGVAGMCRYRGPESSWTGGPPAVRNRDREAIPTMTPREGGHASNRTFNSAQLGGTRSSTRFGVLVPEVKANRQKVKIRKQSGQKMAVKKILDQSPSVSTVISPSS